MKHTEQDKKRLQVPDYQAVAIPTQHAYNQRVTLIFQG
jgi:hypothetical protein